MFNTKKEGFKEGVIEYTLGVTIFLLGFIVIFGWYTNNQALVQVLPTFVPMQYNTALGFLLSGFGLLAAIHKFNRVATIAGATVALLGSLTLIEYVFLLDLGIDQLFMEHYITVKTSHPGRMAPNTALCFSISGALLILLGRTGQGQTNIVKIELLSMTVLGLAIMAMLGYLIKIESAYGWGNLTQMAVHTASGFILFSIAVLCHIWKARQKIARVSLWIPFALLIGTLAFDIYSPLGVAAGVAYVPLVFCSIWFTRVSMPFVFATIVTALIILGYFASPATQQELFHVAALTNRILSIIAVWIVAVIVFLQKKTEEKLIESELEAQASLQFRELIMSHIPDHLFIKDSEFRIIDANPAFLNMYPESTRSSVIGSTTLESYDPAEVEVFLEDDRTALQDGYVETEEKIQYPNGQTRTVFTKKVRFEDSRGEKFVLGVSRDITDRKNMEKTMEENLEKLERSNRDLEQFAYVASHDLQEPLRMVASYTQLLASRYQDQLDETANEFIDFAVDGAKRMQLLIQDLLKYSRLSNVADQFEEVDTNTLYDFALKNVSASIAETGATITKDQLPVVTCDPAQVRQLFQNLISNAVKYSDSDRENKVHVSAKKLHDCWQFCVEDTGIGIDPKFFDRIFVIFQRLHGKSEYQGTGIGLALCARIVDNHQGRIWVESEYGEGSRFFFTLPLKQ